jgi:hypothetical protein
VVTNAITNAIVADPSCTISASMSGVNATSLIYTLNASTAAPIGKYTVTLTGIDNVAPTSGALRQSTTLTLNVVGVDSVLNLAQGAAGTETATFVSTTGYTSAPTTPITFACGTVWNTVTGAVVPAGQYTGLSCAGSNWSYVSGTSTGTATIKIALSTLSAQLETSSSVSLAALLGIPLFALVGWVKGRKSSRRNFFRFLGLIVALAAGISYVTGCGGSFTYPSPVSNGLGNGSYLVQVIATDSATPTHNQYYAVVPLNVSSN